MKLFEIKKDPDGTYVGVKLSKKSKTELFNLAKDLKIPNMLDKSKYHITVIYSRKYLPTFEALGKYDKPIIATPQKFSIFGAKNDENCLVLELNCPEIIKRHKHIMKLYDAVYDFDVYKCHITLSYDVEDFDIKNVSYESLKELEIVEEYKENLNLDWLVKK